ncbi:MAG: hypothetical protein IT336_12725 [Thermomicrobiales bacterium]|nr:hypothetical protein [Thermomicrobiales bacterium]
MTRPPSPCHTCGYGFGRRHRSGRLDAGRQFDDSFALDGRTGRFAWLVCPVCGAIRIDATGPVGLHSVEIARFAGMPREH